MDDASGTTSDSEPGGWIARYQGLRVEDALRLARLERRPVRVVGPDQVVTADWLPNRLTIRVDAGGSVVSLRAG